jgi:hypothetical protein
VDGNFTTVGETSPIARFDLNKGEQTAQAHANACLQQLFVR